MTLKDEIELLKLIVRAAKHCGDTTIGLGVSDATRVFDLLDRAVAVLHLYAECEYSSTKYPDTFMRTAAQTVLASLEKEIYEPRSRVHHL